jgi:hypothetical protein
MIALAAAIRNNWHAVERDLLAMGYHADDIGTKLDTCELISIVVAAPPGTAVHHFSGSWSKTDELLANLSEQQAGVFDINARYARPGVDSAPAKPRSEMDTLAPYKGIRLDAAPVDEFTAKLKERQRLARLGAASQPEKRE